MPLWAPVLALLLAAPAAAQGQAAEAAAGLKPVTPVPPLTPSLSAPRLTTPVLASPLPTVAPIPSVLPKVQAVNAALPAEKAVPAQVVPIKAVETVGRAAQEAPEPDAGAEAASAWAAKTFDNAWVDETEAATRVGFDPGRAPGVLLSSPEKRDWSTTLRVEGTPVVVKRFTTLSRHSDSRRAAQNELLARLFVAEPAFAAVFKNAFTMPRAVAYERESWNPFARRRTYLAMEAAPGRPIGSFKLSDERAWLPTRLAGPLFVLSQALGLGDMNPNGLLVDERGRYTLLDTEVGRNESKPNPALFVPVDMPWVVNEHLNDPADYAPAVEAFRRAFARADADGSLLSLLRKAGLSDKEARRDLEVLRGNVARMDEVLAADIAVADRTFMKDAAQWGLSEAQARRLSDVNRALLAKDGTARERRAKGMQALARQALAHAGEMTLTQFPLGHREWAELQRSEKAKAFLRGVQNDTSSLLPRRDAAKALLDALD